MKLWAHPSTIAQQSQEIGFIKMTAELKLLVWLLDAQLTINEEKKSKQTFLFTYMYSNKLIVQIVSLFFLLKMFNIDTRKMSVCEMGHHLTNRQCMYVSIKQLSFALLILKYS